MMHSFVRILLYYLSGLPSSLLLYAELYLKQDASIVLRVSQLNWSQHLSHFAKEKVRACVRALL